jgi:hypothetical protein
MGRLNSVVVASLVAASSLHIAAQQQAIGAIPTTARTSARASVTKATTDRAMKLLPGTKPNIFTTIQGNALTSTNGALPDSVVRLRDARFGRVVESQVTDKSGLFAFKAVDPGSYIVEIMGNDQSIVAASQMLNVNSGEMVSAVVKMPFRIPPFAGLISSSTPSAAAVATEAATSSVLSTVIATDALPLSPG